MTDSGHLASPCITTIIPTYRRPTLLRRAINSALSQEGALLRVSVFDNASGDMTRDMVSELSKQDGRLLYHCHEKNLGAAANFEFGLRDVTTPFFSILSDDDYLLPGFYRLALEDLVKHPDAMFWAGITLNVDNTGVIWDARVDRWPREGVFTPPGGLMAMMHGMAPIWTGIVFRREILDSIGFPDQQALGPSDLDFILKAAATHPFILRKYPSAVFTLNPLSFSATQPLSSFWPGWKKMIINTEASAALDDHSRPIALAALNQDARDMLFRRGANALSARRYDFVRDAVDALEVHFGRSSRSWILRAVASACKRFKWCQYVYTYAYRTAERRIVKSRVGLESRFGHLIIRP